MSATRFGKVAVLMGGWSAEREVSLKSGNAVLQGLLRKGIDAKGIDVSRDVINQLHEAGFERAFIIMHGRGGEDGVIQGTLEALGIPYTGSGVLGSALSMDKVKTKQIWQAEGLPTLPFAVLREKADLVPALEKLGLPMAVKPAREGSSIGTTKVIKAEQLEGAWEAAAAFDDLVIAEPWLDGGEYTVTILGDKALPIIRVEAANEFYDYEAKYHVDSTNYHCPCGLSEAREAEIQALAVKAFKVLGASGWGRVDVLMDDEGKAWLMENNTVPGMTDHSLVPMAAQAAGIGFDDLVVQILQQSE